VLAKDSTNLAARIELANVLYDRGNWSEAIIHYKAAARLDPQRPTTLVDMGVCYYNLSQFAAAESLFQEALRHDPMQPVALFNLGIVAENQQRYDQALNFYHRALQANPPDAMKQPLTEHLKAVMEKTGKSAPPLGRPGRLRAPARAARSVERRGQDPHDAQRRTCVRAARRLARRDRARQQREIVRRIEVRERDHRPNARPAAHAPACA
jgi:tetratricopeptide (TPR) repeat protein